MSKLEEDFREAIAKLPDYKARMVWDYVNSLKHQITSLQVSISNSYSAYDVSDILDRAGVIRPGHGDMGG